MEETEESGVGVPRRRRTLAEAEWEEAEERAAGVKRNHRTTINRSRQISLIASTIAEEEKKGWRVGGEEGWKKGRRGGGEKDGRGFAGRRNVARIWEHNTDVEAIGR